ncbi:unnamed protein product [Closterium sp. Naga37s-1]|nr:unnamed protein product [Closterium sp. Naga37s-1]
MEFCRHTAQQFPLVLKNFLSPLPRSWCLAHLFATLPLLNASLLPSACWDRWQRTGGRGATVQRLLIDAGRGDAYNGDAFRESEMTGGDALEAMARPPSSTLPLCFTLLPGPFPPPSSIAYPHPFPPFPSSIPSRHPLPPFPPPSQCPGPFLHPFLSSLAPTPPSAQPLPPSLAPFPPSSLAPFPPSSLAPFPPSSLALIPPPSLPLAPPLRLGLGARFVSHSQAMGAGGTGEEEGEGEGEEEGEAGGEEGEGEGGGREWHRGVRGRREEEIVGGVGDGDGSDDGGEESRAGRFGRRGSTGSSVEAAVGKKRKSKG